MNLGGLYTSEESVVANVFMMESGGVYSRASVSFNSPYDGRHYSKEIELGNCGLCKAEKKIKRILYQTLELQRLAARGKRWERIIGNNKEQKPKKKKNERGKFFKPQVHGY